MDLRHPRRGGFNRRFGASSMRDETSDEYAGAFQRFVTNLVVQRSIPSQSRTSRKDVKLPKDGAERVAKTPMAGPYCSIRTANLPTAAAAT
jgi:hypothetical protein